MKFLISFLLFFTGIALGLAAGGAGLILIGSGAVQGWREPGVSPGFWGYLMISALNAMMSIGLILAVVSAGSAACLCVLSFVFKSWSRAIVAGAMCFGAVSVWIYLLEGGL